MNFIIESEIYPLLLMVSIAESDATFKESMDTANWPENLYHEAMFHRSTTNGICAFSDSTYIIIRLRDFPTNPDSFGTLAHEIFHAATVFLRMIGMKLSNKSDEAYAYLIGFITTKIYERLNLNIRSLSPKLKNK